MRRLDNKRNVERAVFVQQEEKAAPRESNQSLPKSRTQLYKQWKWFLIWVNNEMTRMEGKVVQLQRKKNYPENN